MNYSKLERTYKNMSTLKTDDEERLNVNFMSNHHFTIPNEVYKKTVGRGVSLVLFLLVILFF